MRFFGAFGNLCVLNHKISVALSPLRCQGPPNPAMTMHRGPPGGPPPAMPPAGWAVNNGPPQMPGNPNMQRGFGPPGMFPPAHFGRPPGFGPGPPGGLLGPPRPPPPMGGGPAWLHTPGRAGFPPGFGGPPPNMGQPMAPQMGGFPPAGHFGLRPAGPAPPLNPKDDPREWVAHEADGGLHPLEPSHPIAGHPHSLQPRLPACSLPSGRTPRR